jgi:glycosyltransferase involved in cell wall biosynthesis
MKTPFDAYAALFITPLPNSDSQTERKDNVVETLQLEPAAARFEKPIRITEQVWPKGTVPVVSVFCITYNHEKFIRDAIEGFLMQETTFPVEVFIHDDASTDGTADIVQEYAQKYPQLFWIVLQKENQWSKGTSCIRDYLVKQRGLFVALCEGDDYWIDPAKLELQHTRLVENADAHLVCTRYKTLENGSYGSVATFDSASEYEAFKVNRTNWFNPYVLMTCTAMVRNTALKSALQNVRSHAKFKDIFLWRLILQSSDATVLPPYTAIYRKHGGGVFSSLDDGQMYLCNMQTSSSMLRHFGISQHDIISFYLSSAALYINYLKQKRLITRVILAKLSVAFTFSHAYIAECCRLIIHFIKTIKEIVRL